MTVYFFYCMCKKKQRRVYPNACELKLVGCRLFNGISFKPNVSLQRWMVHKIGLISDQLNKNLPTHLAIEILLQDASEFIARWNEKNSLLFIYSMELLVYTLLQMSTSFYHKIRHICASQRGFHSFLLCVILELKCQRIEDYNQFNGFNL